jgi:hypothetical protein
VTVGDDAYTAAGSVITKDVPAGALGVARERQRNVEGYAARREEREKSASNEDKTAASGHDSPHSEDKPVAGDEKSAATEEHATDKDPDESA